jgi:hypothetical protein
MKKLLTIVLVALALCMVAAIALAGTETNMNYYTQAAIEALGDSGYLPDSTEVWGSDIEAVKLATGHNTEAAVKVYTNKDKTTFKVVTVLVNPHVAGTYSVTTPRTCIATGVETAKCTVCGATMTRTIAKKNHGEDPVGDGTWIYKNVTDPTSDDYGKAKLYCTECKVWIPDSEASVEPTHKHAWITKIITMPTCKSNGKAEVACQDCGINRNLYEKGWTLTYNITIAEFNADPFLKAKYGEIDGHNWNNWVTTTAATCAKNATQIRWCSICELKQERQVPNTKLAPVWVTVKNPETITCQDTTVEWVCSVCKGTVEGHKSSQVAGFDNSVNADGAAHSPDFKTVVKVNHVFNYDDEEAYDLNPDGTVKVYKKNNRIGIAKCIEGDYKVAHCQLCETGTKKVYVSEAPGHDWTEWQQIAAPGASGNTDGLWNRTCRVCGKAESYTGTKLPTAIDPTDVPVELDPTEYTTTFDFDKTEMTLSGKATLKEGTEEAESVYARVTYFMADGTYIVVPVPVEADGTYESMNSGNVVHVSVQIVDSAKVRPGEFNRFGGSEKDVK